MSNPLTTLTLAPGMSVEVRGQLALRDDEVVVTGHRMLPGGDEVHLRW